jgi:hypothetical protein
MQADAIEPGQSVIVVDDLLATGECAFRRILTSRIDHKSHTIPQEGPPKLRVNLLHSLEARHSNTFSSSNCYF